MATPAFAGLSANCAHFSVLRKALARCFDEYIPCISVLYRKGEKIYSSEVGGGEHGESKDVLLALCKVSLRLVFFFL